MITYVIVSLVIGVCATVGSWIYDDEPPKWWQAAGFTVIIAVVWPLVVAGYVRDWL